MTKPSKTKGKAGGVAPVLTDHPIYENGKAVGFFELEGDAVEGQNHGK